MESPHTNRLVDESSPYLLQHAHNPVDWWPWCPDALAAARRLDRPILLSIGYSACHWCHVMERESFEDEAIARLMNDAFVCIKVDREERPDLDQVYQTAVQLMTGHGGWPLTMFLTPDLKPFFGGTYFPPAPRYGMPGFAQVLQRVAEVYRSDAAGLSEQGTRVVEALDRVNAPTASTAPLRAGLLDEAAARLARNVDTVHGGFGTRPKFPHPIELDLLLRAARTRGVPAYEHLVRLTLDRMAAGGIYDHLAGGFHRYSVDERWLVPHFEKMLYDNALLARAYLAAWQATSAPAYARVVRETLSYVQREMTHPRGGFWSTQDADAEGEEGRFHVWTANEVVHVIGDPAVARRFMAVYGVTEAGNFEGRNILHRARRVEDVAGESGLAPERLEEELASARAALFAVRERRVKPLLDDKVIASWNGLMIGAFARAAAAFGDPALLESARGAASFVGSELRGDDGRLHRTWRDGRLGPPACLDDHTFLAAALIDLYEADFDPRWLEGALSLMEEVEARFTDRKGGWFLTAHDAQALIQRPRAFHDQSVPSGTAAGADCCLRLASLTGDRRWLDRLEAVLRGHAGDMETHPQATASLVGVADRFQRMPREVVVAGHRGAPDAEALLRPLRAGYRPDLVVAFRDAGADLSGHPARGLLEGKEPRDGRAAAYVCHRFTCSAPATSWPELEALLSAPAGSPGPTATAGP